MDAVAPAVWGVMRMPSADAAPPHGPPHGLAGLLVVVGTGGRQDFSGSVTRVPVDASATTAQAFAAAIRAVPVAAEAVVWLDAALPAPGTIARLVARLGDRDAVVVATPVSDAVKRVHDGVIVGGVAREGLCRPMAPVLVRARAARRRLLPALDAGHDLFDALGVAGCTVTVVAPGARARA